VNIFVVAWLFFVVIGLVPDGVPIIWRMEKPRRVPGKD